MTWKRPLATSLVLSSVLVADLADAAPKITDWNYFPATGRKSPPPQTDSKVPDQETKAKKPRADQR